MENSFSYRKKFLLIIAGIVLVLIVISLVVAQNRSDNTCLSPADYQSLYGEPPLDSHFEPAVSFFQKDYVFQADSTSLDATNSDSPVIDANTLARFYKDRSAKPMLFTLSGVYIASDTASEKIATQRADSIKAALTSAGIPEIIIKTNITPYTPTDDEIAPDSLTSVSLTLASTGNCTQ